MPHRPAESKEPWRAQKPKTRRRRKPTAARPAPPPPASKPSWTLTNGPWIFVESDPGSCRTGPWTRLDIAENAIAEGAPLWHCNQGKVPQAEGGDQSTATIDWLRRTPGGSIAPVTTLGIDPAPYLALGITSCFVECYLQAGDDMLDKYGQAVRDGWLDPIPVIGAGFADVNGTFHVEDYMRLFKTETVPWLSHFGTRFGVYASDPMGDEDWTALAAICENLR